MQASKLIFIALCVILTSVPMVYSYGTIFADSVVPVNADSVHFPDTTSDEIRAKTVNVGSLTLSDPGGFNVDIPELIEISSAESIDLIGELGFSLGGPETSSVSFSVDGDLQTNSQEFFALFSQLSFNIDEEIEQYDTSIRFESARYASIFAGVSIDFEGDDLASVISQHGNTDAVAPNIIGSAGQFLISGDDSVTFKSKTGFIDFTAEDSITLTADIIDLISEQNTEMVADGSFYINAEDTVEFTSGTHTISALGDLTISSDRNVDLTSSSGLFVDAGVVNFSAGSEFYLKAAEEKISQVSGIAGNLVSISASESGFLASHDIVFEIFKSQSIIANSMDLTSISSTIIGNEETNVVNFLAGTNNLSFYLENEVEEGDAFVMKSSVFTFDAANDLYFNADNFYGTAGTSDITVATDTTFLSDGDISFISTSEVGSFSVSSVNGQTYNAVNNLSIGAFATDFTAVGTLTIAAEVIDLTYDSQIDFIDGDILLSAERNLDFSGGSMYGYDFGELTLSANDRDSNPEINVFSAQNMDIYASDAEIYSSSDASFATGLGDFFLRVDEDFTMIADNSIEFLIDDDGHFVLHENMRVTGDSILFENEISSSDDDDFMSFTFGRDIEFSGDAYTFDVDDDLLFEAGLDIIITQFDDSTLLPGNFIVSTLSPRDNSGIFLEAIDGDFSTLSGDTTSFYGFFLSFFAESYGFVTPLITMDATEDLLFDAADDVDIDISSSINFDASGHFIVEANDQYVLESLNGPLEFFAVDSINVTANADVEWDTIDFTASVGWFSLDSSNFDLSVGGNFEAHADSESGLIRFISLDDMQFVHDDSVTITSPIISFKSSGDQLYQSNVGALSITTSEFDFYGHSMDSTLASNFIISSDSVYFYSDEFGAFFDVTVGTSSTYKASESVYFTSDGSITFDQTVGPYTAMAENIYFNGDDSIYLEANNEISIQGTSEYSFNSGGATRFIASNGDINLDSADTFDVTAGRIIMDSWAGIGVDADFTAELGKIQFDSTWGSINIDSENNIILNATNPDASASTFLTSTNGVEIVTENGGIMFNSEGVLPGGNLSFDWLSSGTFGDIVFDALLSGLNLISENDVTYIADNNILLNTAYGADYVPETFMSFDAPSGLFDIDAQRGITINAGKGLDPADISFTQENGSFLMSAANQITFHSTGVVDNESILVDGQSDIRFHTANTGDIRFFANTKLSFDATGGFTSESVNNFFTEATAGSISFSSVTNADFWTIGGPIHFSTFSSLPGGEITLSALNGNVEFTSGNSTYLTAKQFGSFNAENGIFIDSFDGSIDVEAASSSSFINLISLGGFSVTSTGNDVSNDDSIWMDAANNIEYGTVNTNTIAFNAIDRVSVGTESRPIITFNAGGDDTVFGMKITSDGGIKTETDNDFSSSIVGDLLVSTNNFIRSHSTGTASISTIGSDGIFVSSNGLLRSHGVESNTIQSNTRIVGASSGSLQFIGDGPNAVDFVRFTAPDVNLLSGDHFWSISKLDADLTNSFTLSVSGDAIFDGTLDEGSSFEFDATDFFSGVSGGTLDISTDKGNGPILFSTLKSTSDITIETQPGSNIEINSAGEFGIFSDTFSLSSSDITFTAVHTDANDDRQDGDIQIGSENTIDTSNVETLLISGEEFIIIETTEAVDDIGAVLRLDAGGENTISATSTTVIRNIPEQGGDINFTALSDVIIVNVDGGDSFITFEADSDLTQSSVRDTTFTIADTLTMRVGESTSTTANGIDANSDFGIHISVEDLFDIESVFGNVRFTSDSSSVDLIADDVSFISDRNGVFEGFSVDITLVDDVVATSEESAIEMYGRDGIVFQGPATGNGGFTFTSTGVDDNSNFGVRLMSTSSSTGPFEIDVAVDFNSNSEGVNMNAKTISMDFVEDVEFESDGGSLLIDGFASVDFFSQDIQVASGATTVTSKNILVDAQATITFDASDDVTLETTGSASDIDLFSSGATIFRNGVNFSARSALGPENDISFETILGRMEFDSGITNPDGFGIDFVAEYGDFSILALSDDSDVYTLSSQVSFESGNEAAFVSVLNLPGTAGLVLDTGNVNVVAQTHINIFATTLDIESQNAILLLVDDAEGTGDSTGEGGAVVMTATDTITMGSNSGITISSPQQGGKVILSAEDDIIFNTGTVSLDPEAVMKIPRNLNPFDGRPSRNAPCLNGSLFWYDQLAGTAYGNIYPNTVGFLCVCDDNGIPHCHPFREPPCDPTDPYCPY